MRKLIVVQLLILLGVFSCGEEKQPEISENSEDLKIQYWLRKESLLPLGLHKQERVYKIFKSG